MKVQLRRGIAIDGAGGVVLKGRENPPARIDGQMIPPAAGLDVAFHGFHRFRVCPFRCEDQALVLAHQGGERKRLRRAKREIPSRDMPGLLPFSR
jgi:hypothetical protein